jgi:hypothetical protein
MNTESLEALLNEVDQLFTHRPSQVYEYTLGRFAHGWCFKVVNNWNAWSAANRQHEFGPHATPQEALRDFLDYVKENRIHVAGLQE